MSNRTIYILIISIIVTVVIAMLGLELYKSQLEIQQKEAELQGTENLLEYEKQQTERELQALQIEVDAYDTNLANDSLNRLLENQKQKIQQLLDELRTVKATNRQKISELKEELSAVRSVLMNYIHQVDSLNKINARLHHENKEVKVKINKVTEKNEELTKEKNILTEVVTRASMLQADNFNVELYNKRDKKTTNIKKIATIAASFNIQKNVTAEVGERVLYVRIVKPNHSVLSKSKTYTFPYENKNLRYSIKRVIVYKGEKTKETVYYRVNETLREGEYKIEVFNDGTFIGSDTFYLE